MGFLGREAAALVELPNQMALKGDPALAVLAVQMAGKANLKTQDLAAITAALLVVLEIITPCRAVLHLPLVALSASSGALVVAIRQTPQTSN